MQKQVESPIHGKKPNNEVSQQPPGTYKSKQGKLGVIQAKQRPVNKSQPIKNPYNTEEAKIGLQGEGQGDAKKNDQLSIKEQKPNDDYFDIKTGKYIGSDGEGNGVRLITKQGWDYLTDEGKNINYQQLQNNNISTSITSPEARPYITDELAIEMSNHYYQEAGYNLNELKDNSTRNAEDVVAGTSPKLSSEGKLSIGLGQKHIGIKYRNADDFKSAFHHERGGHGKDVLNEIPYLNRILKDRSYSDIGDFWAWETRATIEQVVNHTDTWARTSVQFKQHIYNMYGNIVFKNDETALQRYFFQYGVVTQ